MNLKRNLFFIFIFLTFYLFWYKTGISLPFVLLSIFILQILFPNKWSFFKRLFFSTSIWFLLVSFVTVIIKYFGLTFLDIPIFVSIISLLLLFFKKENTIFNYTKFNLVDLIALLSFIAVFLCFLPSYSRFNNGLRLPIFSVGSDAAVHFNMFKKSVKIKNILYQSNVFENFKPWSIWTEYPPGFYLVGSILYLTVFKSIDLVFLTSFFSIFSIFTYALFIVSLVYLMSYFVLFFNKKRTTVLLTLFSTMFIIIPFFINLFSFGFYSQLVSYLYLICLIICLVDVNFNFKEKFYFCLFFNFGISIVWYFNIPISLMLFFMFYLKNRKNFFIEQYIISFLLILISVYPVYKSLVTFNLVGGVNANGGVSVIPYQYVILGYLIWFSFLKHIKEMIHNNETDKFEYFFWIEKSLLVSTFFSFSLFLFQIFTRGGVGYYFSKSLYTNVIFIFIALVFEITYFTNSILLSKKYIKSYLLIPFLFCLLLFSYNFSNTSISWLLGGNLLFLTRGQYNDLIFLAENRNNNNFDYYPTGILDNQVWAYAYLNRLPKFYETNYPVINFDVSEEQISNFIIDYKGNSKLILLDNKNTQYESFKRLPIDEAEKIKNKIDIYAGGF